jgi:Lon protease-like protein
MEETRLIPVFPLNTVLFPGMVLPLRIFEPRYRLMVRRIMEGDRQFGVALIQEGQEVGTPATPYDMGTVAEISGHEVLPDGQIMIVAVGVRRFRIEKKVEGEPYQQAEVTLIDEGDPEAEVEEALVADSTKSLTGYLEQLAAVTNLTITLPEEALSPIDLSYLMAATVQVDNERKQDLLETIPVEERLRKVLALIHREQARIEAFLEKGRSRGDFFYRGNRISVN